MISVPMLVFSCRIISRVPSRDGCVVASYSMESNSSTFIFLFATSLNFFSIYVTLATASGVIAGAGGSATVVLKCFSTTSRTFWTPVSVVYTNSLASLAFKTSLFIASNTTSLCLPSNGIALHICLIPPPDMQATSVVSAS